MVYIESGALIAEFSYDAFGQRRNPDSWSYDEDHLPSGLAWDSTTRGYTDHEQLRGVALIHMNGRVYDPLIGRVISADPFIPDPTSTQSYNRYSYIRNNPLSRSDPTGFDDDCHPRFCSGIPDGTIRALPGSTSSGINTRIGSQSIGANAPLEGDGSNFASAYGESNSSGVFFAGGGWRGLQNGTLSTSSAGGAEQVPLAGVNIGSTFAEAWRLYHREIIEGSFDGARSNGGGFFIAVSGLDAVSSTVYGTVDGDPTAVVVAVSGLLLGKLKALDEIPWGVLCRNGCEEVAAKIHNVIGGKIHTIVPGLPAGRHLGPRDGTWTPWGHHVVVKDGRVYDALTGPEGVTIDDYKKLWKFADDINFSF